MRTWSVAGYALMVAALLPLIYLRGLFADSAVVITIQALAIVLMVWARVTFGSRSFHFAANPTEGGLVTNGPYRFIRHPIYAAILYFVAPGIVANWSTVNVLLFALLVSGAAVRIYCEEQLVVERYPEYSDYAKRTKRIVPFLL